MKNVKSKGLRWKLYVGSAESYENYFSFLLETVVDSEDEQYEVYSFKLNESFELYSDVEFSDLVRWTLAQAVCYQIINKEFDENRSALRSLLAKTEQRYNKLAKGMSIPIESKKLRSALSEVDFKFNELISDSEFLDTSAFDLKKVNKIFVEKFVDNKALQDQRAELKEIYTEALFFIRESFYCKYSRDGDKNFKKFIREEIYPNKELSNFLKHGKSKESREIKNASAEDKETIQAQESFELFYNAIIRTLQRHIQKEFDGYPGDKRTK